MFPNTANRLNETCSFFLIGLKDLFFTLVMIRVAGWSFG